MKGGIAPLRYQCEQDAQWAIGATRCDDKCANTVLLETQGPCGSVRKCSGDTVTHDTCVQVKMSQRPDYYWRNFTSRNSVHLRISTALRFRDHCCAQDLIFRGCLARLAL